MVTRTEPREAARQARSYPPGTIPALAAFLDELRERRVRYCLWKSNIRLASGLAGTTDLDLLVEREHAASFREVVGRHGLKPLVPPPPAAYPAMEHYLGFEERTGGLFHLHVHYQLVLGEAHVKNYRIPAEHTFLESIRRFGGVPLPAAAVELAILAVRALLKYRARDVIKDVLHIRSPGVPEDMRAEIRWLLHQTSIEEVCSALAPDTHIPPDVVGEFLETATRSERSGYRLLRLRARLRRSLRGLRRRNRLRARVAYLLTAWRQRRGRLGPRMSTTAGGLTLALVGADGSGKSTIAGLLAEWLSWKLEVRLHYMGSKAPSRTSRFLYLAFRALRRTHRAVGRRLGSDSRSARAWAAARDVMLALHHVAIGLDRARRYRAARHDELAGRIVIFDRFPFETLSSRSDHRMLDGPQVATTLGPATGRLVRTIAAIEERLYRGFALPDRLVVLEVSPEVSATRKPDHRPDVLVAKGRAVMELATLARESGSRVDVVTVDADRPLDSVLVDLKRRLWRVL